MKTIKPSRKVTTMIMALIVSAGLTSGALASDKWDKRQERIINKLDMTDVQAEQFKRVMSDAKSGKQDMRAQRQEIQTLSDRGDLAGAADLAAKHARERVYHRAEIKQKLAEFLTPSQMTQLKELREKKAKRYGRNTKDSV